MENYAFTSANVDAQKDGAQIYAITRMQKDREAWTHGRQQFKIQAHRARSKAVALTKGAFHAT